MLGAIWILLTLQPMTKRCVELPLQRRKRYPWSLNYGWVQDAPRARRGAPTRLSSYPYFRLLFHPPFSIQPHWIATNNQYSRLSETVSSQSSVQGSVPSKNTVSSSPTSTKSTGNDGVHMSARGSGVPSGRIIRRTAMPGIHFRLRWRSQELTGGVKMEWRVFRELRLCHVKTA